MKNDVSYEFLSRMFDSVEKPNQALLLWFVYLAVGFSFHSLTNTHLYGTDSASLGAALRAAHGLLCSKNGSFVPISCMYKDKLEHSSLKCKLSAKAGDQQLVSKYAC